MTSPPVVPGVSELAHLGSGGFADVYKGRLDHLNRAVAVKVFKVTLVEQDAEDQFRLECGVLGRLSEEESENIVRVHVAGVLPDARPYLIMERCDASLLSLVERRGPLPVGEVATYGYEIAVALMAAHFAGVLHGDVTPQNILLRRSGTAVLADFGLAVLHDYRGNTANGFNPAHAAPEALRNAGAIGHATDVYGLGSTLHTLLSGAPPFAKRPGEDDRARSLRILSEQPPRLDPTRAPATVADLLVAMLDKEPARRPALTDVADRLNAVRGGGRASRRGAVSVAPAPARGPGPVYAPPAPAPGPVPIPTEATRSRAGVAPVPGCGNGYGSGYADPAPSYAPVEPTRARAGSADPAPPAATARPKWILPAAVAAVLVAAGTVASVVLTSGDAETPAPSPAAPAAGAQAATAITLAVPADNGSKVTLHWSGPSGTDYNVVVARDGQAATNTITKKATDLTVDVDPAAKYCFRVQGTDGRTGVVQSNVRAIRGAVCRFG